MSHPYQSTLKFLYRMATEAREQAELDPTSEEDHLLRLQRFADMVELNLHTGGCTITDDGTVLRILGSINDNEEPTTRVSQGHQGPSDGVVELPSWDRVQADGQGFG